MNLQVVENQKHLLAAHVLDQPLQEIEQDVGVHRSLEDFPAHLTAIRHGRHHRQAFASARHAPFGCLADRRIGTASYVIRAQSRFVAPLDFRALGFCPARNLRIRLVQPRLDRLRSLLVGPLHRLLRREAPARQIQADTLQRQRQTASLPDQFPHGMSCPQCERHLRLVRHLVAQQHANVGFLLLRQRTTSIHRAPTGFVAQGRRAIERIPLADIEHPRTGQVRMVGNFVIGPAALAQVDHLPTPLFTCLTRKRSHVSFFHALHMRGDFQISRSNISNQYCERNKKSGV
ncbi:Uncharacterised protein [Burkholderia pseudomallei]|nr:Uncharacterised protein [Burkholderia pseudomallei]